MKIAFVHYHLKTGGVTTVLRQQVEAIFDTCDSMVLAGTPPKTSFPCDTVHIPGLGYDRPGQTIMDPEESAAAIDRAIHLKWKDGCDLVHVHNPTLAKNRNFLKILKTLQKKGVKLFLQIHDFAEDGRPLAYFSEDDYVQDCHYGVINSRDYDILLNAGLKPEGLHKIFNTINPLNLGSAGSSLKNYVLYPIRAIRRKNIGEAILLSLFFKNKASLVITLPPNSPMDIKSYEGWKGFVKENNLNVIFDAGLNLAFSDLVSFADYLITTSITEGFGFSFLEPWTAKKILWGRKLPDVCRDFEKNRIQLDHLYTRLDVPIKWLREEKLFSAWKACAKRIAMMFDTMIDDTSIRNGYKSATENHTIDFGLLDESFQKTILSQVLSDKARRDRLIRLNPYLASPGKVSDKDALTDRNMEAVLLNYNKTTYRKNLLNIYGTVIRNPVRQKIDKKKLLSEFLTLDNFSLLKWCDYAEK